MADSENSVIEINFDTGKIEDGLNDLMGGISAIKTAMAKLDQSINKGFASGMGLLRGIHTGVADNGKQIANGAKTLESAISGGMGEIASQLGAIHGTMGEVINQMGKMNIADVVGMVSGGIDIDKNAGKTVGKLTGMAGMEEQGLVGGLVQNLAEKLPFDTAAMAESINILTQRTAAWLADTAAVVGTTAATWAHTAATTAWQAICTAATAVTSAFGAAMSFLTSPITLVVAGIAALIAIIVLLVKNWDTVKATAISVWETIKEAFGNAWKWFQDAVLEPLANGFKGMVNGIIGFINGLIAGVVNGINAIIGLLNKINFDIPDWIPGLGGQTFGFNLTPLTAPQIPLLAKGAVLPANKPFLAVVGDQRHGTNIEAPLATIQEAVALVMNDQVAAMMAGFEATVEEVRLLRQMVSGIEIGDSTIGQAARRYERKMAVVTGGRY